MLGVFFAERAIFVDSKPVGIVALIFIAVVIAVLANRALKRYFSSDLCLRSHFGKLRTKKLHPFLRCKESLTYFIAACQLIFCKICKVLIKNCAATPVKPLQLRS